MFTYPVGVRDVGVGGGREVMTTDVQVGLVKRRHTFHEIFASATVMFLVVLIVREHGDLAHTRRRLQAAA